MRSDAPLQDAQAVREHVRAVIAERFGIEHATIEVRPAGTMDEGLAHDPEGLVPVRPPGFRSHPQLSLKCRERPTPALAAPRGPIPQPTSKQTGPHPTDAGLGSSPGRTRTCNLAVNSRSLYH